MSNNKGRTKAYWLAYYAKWDKDHPESRRKTNQAQKLKKYGLTIAQYTALSVSQNGVCAICFRPETTQHKHRTRPLQLAVDHNHATNKARGLLCRQCNMAIGYLQDDPLRAYSAARYLEKYAEGEGV